MEKHLHKTMKRRIHKCGKDNILLKKICNIGQVLTLEKDTEIERISGIKDKLKKGTKIFVGADNFAHYRNGFIQPLENIKVEGYSVIGLAEFIWLYIRNRTPVDEECLKEYGESSDSIKEAIIDALEELGMYDHMGNKS